MTSNETLVLQTMSSDAFVMVNKQLVRFFKGDGDTACFLSELISAYKYHINNQTIEPDGAFAIPIRRYKIIFGFSAYKQDRMLKRLEDCGLAFTRLQGFPAIKHVRVDFDALARILQTNDLEYKQIEKAEFYSQLNEELQSNSYTKSTLIGAERACDNMGPPLRGTLIILSQYRKRNEVSIEWSSPAVGKIKGWVNKRALGKAFDFSIVTRTLDAMNDASVLGDFDQFINDFITTAKGVQDVHYLRQVLEYGELFE